MHLVRIWQAVEETPSHGLHNFSCAIRFRRSPSSSRTSSCSPLYSPEFCRLWLFSASHHSSYRVQSIACKLSSLNPPNMIQPLRLGAVELSPFFSSHTADDLLLSISGFSMHLYSSLLPSISALPVRTRIYILTFTNYADLHPRVHAGNRRSWTCAHEWGIQRCMQFDGEACLSLRTQPPLEVMLYFTYMRTQRLICATSWICPRSHCACRHVRWCEHEDVTMWSVYYRPHWLGQ